MAKKRSKHRGAATVRAAEPERLALPLFIRKELARLKKAGLWLGDPEDPALDPAVKLSMLMVDPNVSPELQAVCGRTLIEYVHDSRSLILKAEQGPENGPVFILVKQFGSEQSALPAPTGNVDYNEPFPIYQRHLGTPPGPEPATPAAVDRTNAPGAALYAIETGADGLAHPIKDEARVPTGYYEARRGDDGVERLVETDKPPREYRGTPPEPTVVIKDFSIC